MRWTRFPAALGLAGALLAAAGAGVAHEYRLGDLTIDHPHALATPPGARAGAGYLSVTNAGASADRLVAVRADFPAVQLHVTEVDAAGVARMTETEGIEVPPGATATLAPRGAHVMFMGLTAPLAPGDAIPATLVFEKAGEIAVEFAVEARGPADGDHAGEGGADAGQDH